MAFKRNDRVKVSNQNSQYRNLMGAVKRVRGQSHGARVAVTLDTQANHADVVFDAGELVSTTQEIHT